MFLDVLSRFVRPSASKKTSRKAGKVNHRSLCFETLESRELLAVSVDDFATYHIPHWLYQNGSVKCPEAGRPLYHELRAVGYEHCLEYQDDDNLD